MYARLNQGKKELIVLNNTDDEQVVDRKHFHKMLEESHLKGVTVHNGEPIDLSTHVTIGARRSLVIQL
jgi:hypothetical protein